MGTITAVSDGKKVTFQTERNAEINTLDQAGPGQKNEISQKDETGQKNEVVPSADKAAVSDSSAENGETETVRSGEVSVRGLYGYIE